MTCHHTYSSSSKTLWLSVSIILIFALIETAGGYLANSLALLSDAAHMAVDTFSLVIAAVAAWLSQKPATRKNTYGLARIEVLTACASSLLLIAIAVSIATEAIDRFASPKTVTSTTVIFIALIGLAANLIVAWILHRGEQTLNTKAAFFHVIGDLLGSLATLTSGIIIYFTGWMPIDPILSLVICALILFISLRLLYKTLSILMESAPHEIDVEEIGYAMAEINHVTAVHDLHVWTISSNKLILSAHIELAHLQYWPQVLNSTKFLLENRFGISHITIQPETEKTSLTYKPNILH